jgi:hypothetical protein
MPLKRLSALMAAVFFLLTAFTSIAYADSFPGTSIPTGTNSSTIIFDAETNYGIWNENKPQQDAQQSYNLGYVAPSPELQVTVQYNGQSIPTNYGELAYGNPCGDYSDGHYRYLGYTYEGDYYTNIAYPPDAIPDGADFETQQWIEQPWSPGSPAQTGAIKIVPTPWEGQASYTDPVTGQSIPTNTLIMAGMWYLQQTAGVGGVDGEPGSGFSFNLDDGNAIWNNLYDLADVMMPPTRTTWGMARMFHMKDGYPYYVDLPLPPLALGELPYLTVEPASTTVGVGQTQWYHDYYHPADGGQPVDMTTSSQWSTGDQTIATIGASTGGAVGVAPGTTGIAAVYTDGNGVTVQGSASITVAQGVLTVTPATQTILVGSTASYISTYYPTQDDANAGADGTVVTLQSTWTSSDTSIATPASTPGLFNGVSPGTVTVTATYSPGDGASLTAYYPSGGSQSGGQDADTLLTYTQRENPVIADYFPSQSRYVASYTPPSGSALTGTASLTVTAPQPPPSNGYTATLSFAAINQSEIKTMMGVEIGGTLQRKANTAMWTDTVTATLAADQQPQVPSSAIPAGGEVQSVTWSISDVNLTYPAQNPDYTFGNPVEPTTTTPASMTVGNDSSGSGHQATASFEEKWSEDGLNGGKGIHDTLTGSTVAASPVSYPISATFTVSGTVSGVIPQPPILTVTGWIYPPPIPFSNPFTLSGSAEQDLLVGGTGAVPMTSAGQNYMVGVTSNPSGTSN